MRPVQQLGAVATLTADLDRGESEAIVLLREAGPDVLLLGERRTRPQALSLGPPVAGTIGLLRLARAHASISSVAPGIEQLQRHRVQISTEL